MEPKSTGRSCRHLLLKLALGVLVVLLVLPVTRYLFLSQLQTEFVPSRAQDDAKRLHETALQRCDDYLMQLADALNPTEEPGKYSSVSKRERLQELAKRFPDRPSVYANMLRFMAQGEAIAMRDEEYVMSGREIPAAPRPAVKPEIMAIYENAAVEGERLDPTNAYFPLMRAAGLFGAHRDAEALQEIHRAAQSARWDDYCQDEVVGDRRLSEAAYGERPARYRLCQAAAILLPHYARMRAAANIAAYLAVQEEGKGDPESGFAIREDILRIGSLVRSQSPWAIGSQVGIGITDIGMTRPGGAPFVKGTLEDDFSARLSSDVQDCAAYFQRIGHRDAATRLTSEVQASLQAREIIKSGETKSLFNYFSWDSLSFIPIWLLSSLLPLANIVTLLALGAFAYLLLWMRARRVSLWLRALAFAGLMSLLAVWQCHVVEGALSLWIELCRNLGVKECPFVIDNPGWFTLGCFVVPILMLGGLALFALFSRVPLHLALARGMRHLAVPAACLLVLAYGVLLAGLSYQEHRLNSELDRMSQHEGKYLAELAGKEWPGPVR